MSGIRVELPWPPSVNHMYRRAGRRKGRRGIQHQEDAAKRPDVKLTAEAVKYRKDVGWLRPPGWKPLAGPLSVIFYAYRPEVKRAPSGRWLMNDRVGQYDLDNGLKAPIDALEHAGFFHNDNQIQHLEILDMGERTLGGKLVVEIRQLTPEQLAAIRAHDPTPEEAA